MDIDGEIIKSCFHSSMNKVRLSIEIYCSLFSVYPNKSTICLMVYIRIDLQSDFRPEIMKEKGFLSDNFPFIDPSGFVFLENTNWNILYIRCMGKNISLLPSIEQGIKIFLFMFDELKKF